MTLADVKNYVYRRTKTNSTSFPAADMLIAVNNGLERVETVIRPWLTEYNPTRFTSGDLSTGTAEPKFHSLFHEVIPLWISYQYAVENGLGSAPGILAELTAKEDAMRRWYGQRNYRVATVTIASPGVFTLNNHGFAQNDRIILETTGALPTGLSAGTWYYVIYVDAHSFKVTATRDGTAINTTVSQSGTHFVGCEKGSGKRLMTSLESTR